MIVDLYKSGMPLSKLNSEYGRGFAMQNLRENELMPLNGDTVIGGVLKLFLALQDTHLVTQLDVE